MTRQTSTAVVRSVDPTSDTVTDVPKPAIDPDIPDDLITLKDAADVLNVNKARAHVILQKGDLPGRQLSSGAWVFRRSLVEELRPKIGKKATE
jgi:hypothetical protein